jgi:hypothetical protein
VAALIPSITSALAFGMALLLLTQWAERRHAYQLVWALGMLFFGIASGCEALAEARVLSPDGWTEALYRTWYLTGAVWTAGWLGLGTIFLLARTRFGFMVALSIGLAGLFTFLTQQKYHYEGAGSAPVIYLVAAAVLAVAIAFETYLRDSRWPAIAAAGIVGASLLSVALMATTVLPAPGYAVDAATGQPTAELLPGSLRLLTPFLNITGGMALAFGAIFSAYTFMPKRRVLDYSLDEAQSGDQYLFNMFLAVVAIPVNFIASIPGALAAFARGTLHPRVTATILIALGGFAAGAGDALNRFGITGPFAVAKFIAVILLLVGFVLASERREAAKAG